MAWAKRLSLCLGALSACDPQQGGTSASAGETTTSTDASTTSGTDASTAGTEATTEATPTTGEPGEPLGCADVRWAYDVAKFQAISDLAVDSRGHVRATLSGAEVFRVLDLDTGGVEVGAFEVSSVDAFVRWGGLDGDDNVVLQVQEDGPQWPRDWVRKFSLDGALLWEVEFAAKSDGFPVGRPAPGPDGSVLVSRSGSLHKFAADGSPVWEQANLDGLQPFAVNAAGVSVAWLLATKIVRVLDPAGIPLWQAEWGQEGLADRFIVLDGAGDVVVGEQHHGLARFSGDGALAWEKTEAELGLRIDGLVMNEAGQLAVLGLPDTGPQVVVSFGPDGAEVGRRACTQLSHVGELAIDAAGRVTIAGYDFIAENGQFDWWIVAFDG
ncbi:hypothetical protein [Nannocystis bainbridge]|uniref:Uncharacterized protein n=1 Tax=Nannocystis bainbridge TaxID=2995303 RepID=A0ABT5DZM9_9BACT|nr:hypothetical protein [Nannocystis bainbridge]MDC0717916.1 hypothetical protein [Nannocystis bainbridge]